MFWASGGGDAKHPSHPSKSKRPHPRALKKWVTRKGLETCLVAFCAALRLLLRLESALFSPCVDSIS